MEAGDELVSVGVGSRGEAMALGADAAGHAALRSATEVPGWRLGPPR
ncbi:MAG TPA: hypothetical protein VGO78_23985 [Acidimicrobiales bacterium]|nr:hypothetical protein [Acidimicrobiales bacterium]